MAVSIGPEHGTVGPQLIKEAAKEAVRGIGFDLLVVCGFAFDPHVTLEADRYGKLQVLIARMNPDLAMGDALLKKTGSGNLFMVFGEPDLEVHRENGQVVVELKGLDIYDPTTGEIRASSTDDIACWFIDTDYNEESFFVRHAYFTGANRPYDRLKRALRADVDESAWEALYTTTSRPFDPPESGKIAVKVINHYGDEVLKVYEMQKVLGPSFGANKGTCDKKGQEWERSGSFSRKPGGSQCSGIIAVFRYVNHSRPSGFWMRRKRIWQWIAGRMEIKQRVCRYEPVDKLLGVLITILTGAGGLVEHGAVHELPHAPLLCDGPIPQVVGPVGGI